MRGGTSFGVIFRKVLQIFSRTKSISSLVSDASRNIVTRLTTSELRINFIWTINMRPNLKARPFLYQRNILFINKSDLLIRTHTSQNWIMKWTPGQTCAAERTNNALTIIAACWKWRKKLNSFLTKWIDKQTNWDWKSYLSKSCLFVNERGEFYRSQ